MKLRARSLSLAFNAGVVLLVAGCSNEDAATLDDDVPLAETEQALRDGGDTKRALFDAVGVLVQIHRAKLSSFATDDRPCGAEPSDVGVECARSRAILDYTPLCTGTLVGPNAVLTAKHCLQEIEHLGEAEVGFALGGKGEHPAAVYPIVDWDWEIHVPADPDSLLQGMGSDIGVAHLGRAVKGVVPMEIGVLRHSDIGKRFIHVGFEPGDNHAMLGMRQSGPMTLRGIGGNYADYAFGGLSGFLRVGASMPDFMGMSEVELIDAYNRFELLAEYQAFFGGKCGDMQPCGSDLGGPLVASSRRGATVFGIVTNVFGSSRAACAYGAVAAIVGPLTRDYVVQSLHWIDSCVGIPLMGRCAGDLAVRCTSRAEGERRLSETDCSLIGQTCGRDETGAVACVDPMN